MFIDISYYCGFTLIIVLYYDTWFPRMSIVSSSLDDPYQVNSTAVTVVAETVRGLCVHRWITDDVLNDVSAIVPPPDQQGWWYIRHDTRDALHPLGRCQGEQTVSTHHTHHTHSLAMMGRKLVMTECSNAEVILFKNMHWSIYQWLSIGFIYKWLFWYSRTSIIRTPLFLSHAF